MLNTSTNVDGDVTGWLSGGVSALGKVGVTGSYTPGSRIFSYSLNVGLGLPIGQVPLNGAAGVSNTYIMERRK